MFLEKKTLNILKNISKGLTVSSSKISRSQSVIPCAVCHFSWVQPKPASQREVFVRTDGPAAGNSAQMESVEDRPLLAVVATAAAVWNALHMELARRTANQPKIIHCLFTRHYELVCWRVGGNPPEDVGIMGCNLHAATNLIL